MEFNQQQGQSFLKSLKMAVDHNKTDHLTFKFCKIFSLPELKLYASGMCIYIASNHFAWVVNKCNNKRTTKSQTKNSQA